MSANSWMQHPTGFVREGHVFKIADWMKVVFNPATLPRFIHMMLASYISEFFVIVSVSAFYLLKNQFKNFAKILALKSKTYISILPTY